MSDTPFIAKDVQGVSDDDLPFWERVKVVVLVTPETSFPVTVTVALLELDEELAWN